jgi:hypothetical protein
MNVKTLSIGLALTVMGVAQINAASVEKPWDYSFKNQGHYLNANHKQDSGNVNMWHKMDRPDALWNFSGDAITIGNNFCLNAFNAGPGSNVNIFTCSPTDPDQKWDTTYLGNDKVKIQFKGSNLCLNSHKVKKGSNVNLYKCVDGDPEQVFTRQKVLLSPPD